MPGAEARANGKKRKQLEHENTCKHQKLVPHFGADGTRCKIVIECELCAFMWSLDLKLVREHIGQ